MMFYAHEIKMHAHLIIFGKRINSTLRGDHFLSFSIYPFIVFYMSSLHRWAHTVLILLSNKLEEYRVYGMCSVTVYEKGL